MYQGVRSWVAAGLMLLIPASGAVGDDSRIRSEKKTDQSQTGVEQDVPQVDLLDALRDGLISATGEGIGDGRMTMSVTNRTKRRLRVVLPPGIVAQGATGQFGGMGGMGGGMMGGGMGGMGGGMGGGM